MFDPGIGLKDDGISFLDDWVEREHCLQVLASSGSRAVLLPLLQSHLNQSNTEVRVRSSPNTPYLPLLATPCINHSQVEACGHVAYATTLPPAQRLATAWITLLLYLPEGVGGGGGRLQNAMVCLALAAVHYMYIERKKDSALH